MSRSGEGLVKSHDEASSAFVQGYAELLVRQCEDYARSLGSHVIYLHADLDYRPAVRLYGKLGYQTVRDDPAFVKRLGMTQLRYFKKELD